MILNSELFRSVWRYCILFAIVIFRITSCCRVQIYTRRRAESSLFNCKPVQEHYYRCLAIPNIYTITTFVSLYNNNGVTWAKKPQRNWRSGLKAPAEPSCRAEFIFQYHHLWRSFFKNKYRLKLSHRLKAISGTLTIIVNSYNMDLIAISLRLIKMSINRPGCGL